MNNLESIFISYREGGISLQEALKKTEELSMKNLGHTLLDMDRERRTGFPEAVFCQGKSAGQIRDILTAFQEKKINTLATRLDRKVYEKLADSFPGALYNDTARLLSITYNKPPGELKEKGFIAVVSAGTSDMPAAEEAALTAEFYGCSVRRFSDVGVAGLHRLISCIGEIREAKVVIAAAGMEGALASVAGGLVKVPVIALPVSVGYGASFGGFTALLAMLNSCASGTAVVNIDNGYGAACIAARIMYII